METFPAIVSTAKEVGIPFVGHVSFKIGIWRAIDANYSSIDHLDGFVEGMVPGIENMSEQQTGLFAMYIADNADESQIPRLMKGLKKIITFGSCQRSRWPKGGSRLISRQKHFSTTGPPST